MKTLPLVTVPAENLRQPSKKVDNILDDTFKTLVPQMIETMFKEDGVGLAAPQIGINIRLAIVSAKKGPLVCFNPVIKKRSWAKPLLHEGCLSVPGYFGNVKRHRKIMVEFFNEKNEKITLEAHGLLAQIFQHEIDHLDGILYVDRAKTVKEIPEDV